MRSATKRVGTRRKLKLSSPPRKKPPDFFPIFLCQQELKKRAAENEECMKAVTDKVRKGKAETVKEK